MKITVGTSGFLVFTAAMANQNHLTHLNQCACVNHCNTIGGQVCFKKSTCYVLQQFSRYGVQADGRLRGNVHTRGKRISIQTAKNTENDLIKNETLLKMSNLPIIATKANFTDIAET